MKFLIHKHKPEQFCQNSIVIYKICAAKGSDCSRFYIRLTSYDWQKPYPSLSKAPEKTFTEQLRNESKLEFITSAFRRISFLFLLNFLWHLNFSRSCRSKSTVHKTLNMWGLTVWWLISNFTISLSNIKWFLSQICLTFHFLIFR